ncbi:MAG: zinc-ribbon domain-containing protein, partial [Acidimicrobiales bacterium]|nr:zinc-ribbon domain-containing protein [Acidimicrobiales bacterium]
MNPHFCPNCGEALDPGAHFCASCGHHLEVEGA